MRPRLLRPIPLALFAAVALSSACNDGDGSTNSVSGALSCDVGKTPCPTGNGYQQLCVDEEDKCFWVLANDGICFADEGHIELCSEETSDLPPVGGELVSCGPCDDPDPDCTPDSMVLCDEMFTGSPLPSCTECRDPVAASAE